MLKWRPRLSVVALRQGDELVLRSDDASVFIGRNVEYFTFRSIIGFRFGTLLNSISYKTGTKIYINIVNISDITFNV